MRTQVKLIFPAGPRGQRRRFTEARKKVLVAVGAGWRKEKLAGHFRADATRKYGFQKRTDDHLERKRREGKGEDPNVYTGRLRDKMTSTRPAFRVTRSGITLTWRGLPRYTYVRSTYEFTTSDRRWNDAYLAWLESKGYTRAAEGIKRFRRARPDTKQGRMRLVNRPDKTRELTAVNQADAKEMARWMREALRRELRQNRGR